MTIKEFRQKYPQYNDLSDNDLALRLYNKYYSDMDFNEFRNKIGMPDIVLPPDQLQGKSDAEVEDYILDRINESRKMEDARKTMSTLGGAMLTSGERVLNDATFGGYGALNDALGGNFDERNQVGQENLKNAGAGWINTASNIANTFIGGAPLGTGLYNAAGRVTTKALPRLMMAAGAGGALSSGLNSRGSVAERLTDALAAGAVGVALAPVMYGAGKGIEKIANRISAKHGSAKYSDVAGDINAIANNKDSFRQVRRGINASDDVAQMVREQTDDALLAKSQEVKQGVGQILDKAQRAKTGTGITANMRSAQDDYAAFMKQYGDTLLDEKQVADLISRYPDIQPYLERAITRGEFSRGKPVNSLAVLQDVNSRMKMDLRNVTVDKSIIRDKAMASSALDKLLDGAFSGKSELDKMYRGAKLKFDLMDALDNVGGKENTNIANKLLTTSTKQQIADLYGNDIANQVAQYLRGESRAFDNLSALNRSANSKLHQLGNNGRPLSETMESAGAMVGNLIDKISAAMRRGYNANMANRILSGNVGNRFQVSPIAEMLATVGNASLTPDNMQTLRLNQQENIDLPLTVNGLSPKESDKYYHIKGQYQNAQKRFPDFINSQIVGALKEGLDMGPKLARGVGLGTSLRDAGDDLTANWTGGINGLNNPYPADKDNRFLNTYKTKDMRLLDAMLEALK